MGQEIPKEATQGPGVTATTRTHNRKAAVPGSRFHNRDGPFGLDRPRNAVEGLRWELKTSQTGGSAKRSQQTLTHLGAADQ